MLFSPGAAYSSCWRRRRGAAPIVAAGNLGTKKYSGGNSCASLVLLRGRWVPMGMLQGSLNLTRKPGLSKAFTAPGTPPLYHHGRTPVCKRNRSCAMAPAPLSAPAWTNGSRRARRRAPFPRGAVSLPSCPWPQTGSHPASASLPLPAGAERCPAAPRGVSLGPGPQHGPALPGLRDTQSCRTGCAQPQVTTGTCVGTIPWHCGAPWTYAATAFQSLTEETDLSEPGLTLSSCWTNCTYLY